MHMKYAEIGCDPESVSYEVASPASFEDRFEEIQDLRMAYYANHLRFPDGQRRTISEVRHFVGRLTFEIFANPQLAVGFGARQFQEYREPKAALAMLNGEIVGMTRGARNSSSRIQRKLDDKNIFPELGAKIGKAERKWKFSHRRDLVWIAEEVHDPALPIMGPVCTDIFLSEYAQNQISSQWPYDEELGLMESLRIRGYDKIEETVDDVDVEQQFGLGARATKFGLWVSPALAEVRSNIVAGEPVLAAEIDRAHKSLNKNT